MNKAENFYTENINKASSEVENLNNIISRLGWSRLVIVILAALIGVKLYNSVEITYLFIEILIALVLFLVVANIHGKKIIKRDRLNVIIEYNEKAIKRLNGEYKEFQDKGLDLIEDNHPFGNDLDIFGQNSLFQMINATRTRSGRQKLGEILALKNLPKASEIVEKQEAIKELGSKASFREKLYVNATFKKSKNEELDDLIEWTKDKSNASIGKIVTACIFIGITMIAVFLSIIKVIPFTALILDLMINFIMVKLLTKDKRDAISLFQTMKYNVKAYANILILIDEEEFSSKYLKNLKNKINENSEVSCSTEMNKLASLLEWVGDSAGNAYFFLLNVILFADVFILHNLNKWRDQNGTKVSGWLEIMGEFDALSSISSISFDHEDWCYANITEEKQVIAVEMAHPLIGDRAVANTYELKKPKQITLITGSNMSGKSTFLRTIGVNMVLTYIGAPAYAKSLSCSVMNIYTCMRTKDNLEESISSFYAEILRIKLIIEACKKGENVFFLLDEIFKGTNSKDRHIGATVLVKQLAESGAIGLLSTHDLELCELEQEMKELDNYNFREYYRDNKINFDYMLRKGKSTTQNAVYLMRIAGIEIQ